MYNDPNILIFDEATNALDMVNEKQIIEEIFSKTINKTIILVSHNKENFKFCDHVYKIENKKFSRGIILMEGHFVFSTKNLFSFSKIKILIKIIYLLQINF